MTSETSELQPLVDYPSSPSSESVSTVLQFYNEGKYTIADFQRDSDEWDKEKKSLFIESVLNNLTTPSLFLAATSKGKYEVIDGQQRLTTLYEFSKGKLTLLDQDEADYLPDRAIYYAGKNIEDLKNSSKAYFDAFYSYVLPLIKLPEKIDDSTRREIFRRINEGGTPLSAHDIRLAYYGNCATVSFIRAAGIYDENKEGAKRILTNSKSKFSIEWPWKDKDQTVKVDWYDWWKDRQTSIGQSASEMFLWFLISKYIDNFDAILRNEGYLSSNLKTHFDGRTESAGDIFCAELQYEANNSKDHRLLCDLSEMKTLFYSYSDLWFTAHNEMPGVGVDKARKLAFVLAALETNGKKPTADQWNDIQGLLYRPTETSNNMGIALPLSKGKWTGTKGQKEQIKAYFSIINKIMQ